jgi:predicted DNA-binding protein with PD1-like motif
MKAHIFRLRPHDDLRKKILEFSGANKITAAVMVTCVGSLEQFNLRFANQSIPTQGKGHFEIVSLTGTVSASSSHLHIAIADENGKVIGGHLMDENYIYTTAEIAMIELQDIEFCRETDPTYGYRELIIKKLGS